MDEHRTITGHLERLVKSKLAPTVISIIPPDGPLHPNSRIPPEARGKVPGTFTNGSWTGTPDWPNAPALTLEQARTQDRAGGNAGIRCGDLVIGIDLDITDASLVEEFCELAATCFGEKPPKRGVTRPNHNKVLLAVRVTDIFGRPVLPKSRDIRFTSFDGTPHLIQVLSRRKQFVARGQHPLGGEYTWDIDIADHGPLEVTEDQFAVFLDAVFELLDALGCTLKPGAGSGGEDEVDQEKLNGTEKKVASELDMKAVEAMRGKAVDDLPQDLRDRFEEALRQVESFGILWRDGGTGDGSVNVILLANHLHSLGFSVTEFGTVVQVWDHAEGSKGINRADGNGNGDRRSLVRAWAKAVLKQDKGDAHDAFKEVYDDNGDETDEDDGTHADGPMPEFDALSDWNPWQETGGVALPDLDLLPETVRDYVQLKSRLKGCSLSAYTLAMLAGVSIALDQRISLRPKQNDDYLVSSALWALLVGDPSTRKSAPIGDVRTLLSALDKRDFVARRHAIEKHGFGPDAEKKMAELEKTTPPSRRRVISDTTSEALCEILSSQDTGIGLVKDEISGWIGGMEKYGGGGKAASGQDRAVWIKGHDREFGYTQHRKNRPVHVNVLSASILGAIQPDRLKELPRLETDGLLQRFVVIIMSPPTAELDEVFDKGIMDKVSLLFERLDAIDPKTVFKLAAEATLAYLDFANKMGEASKLRVPTHDFGSFMGKQARTLAVITLHLHAVDVAEGRAGIIDEVPLATLERAKALTWWLIRHAWQFYATRNTRTTQDVQLIAAMLIKRAGRKMTSRNMARACRALRGIKLPDLQNVLSVFEANNWLVPDTISPTNGIWSVNPALEGRFEKEMEDHAAFLKEVCDKIAQGSKT